MPSCKNDFDQPVPNFISGTCTEIRAPGDEVLKRSSAEDWARWAESRAQHRPLHEQIGKGRAKGTLASLQQNNTFTLICAEPSCRALIDKHSARRQAVRSGRTNYIPGDGCGSYTCAQNRHHKRRFKDRQMCMKAQLASGARVIVRWPTNIFDKQIVFPRVAPLPQ